MARTVWFCFCCHFSRNVIPNVGLVGVPATLPFALLPSTWTKRSTQLVPAFYHMANVCAFSSPYIQRVREVRMSESTDVLYRLFGWCRRLVLVALQQKLEETKDA